MVVIGAFGIGAALLLTIYNYVQASKGKGPSQTVGLVKSEGEQPKEDSAYNIQLLVEQDKLQLEKNQIDKLEETTTDNQEEVLPLDPGEVAVLEEDVIPEEVIVSPKITC